MFRFFRLIRSGALRNGKFTRYILYATGEIILVVIGILIALQVNNWNTSRIDQRQAEDYLKRIVQDLNIELEELIDVAGDNDRRLIRAYDVIKQLDPDPELHQRLERLYPQNVSPEDSIEFAQEKFGYKVGQVRVYDNFNRTTNAIDEILSNGKIDIIRNDELKEAILAHYAAMDGRLQLSRKIEDMRDYFVNYLIEQGVGMFNRQDYPDYIKNFEDVDPLRAHIENLYFITGIVQNAMVHNEGSLKNDIEDLIKKIEQELESP